MKNKRAFTLIELVSVLVILAILALIVTPLVLNIIRKARTAADKRSIDAYGRSIELAVADYLLDTGNFPTSIEDLTIEYSGDRVECETTQLNSDSSAYLSECTVGNRAVEGYIYGRAEGSSETYREYTIGTIIQYKGESFYVIEDSGSIVSTVKLMKANPLTYEEVQTYSEGTGASTSNNNSIGGMQYHSDSSNYATSYIKTTIDAWAIDKFGINKYEEARLITIEELENLGYELENINPTTQAYVKTEITPSWLYSENYWYWTMSQYNDNMSCVWYVRPDGNLDYYLGVSYYSSAVRPVIVLLKTVLENQ